MKKKLKRQAGTSKRLQPTYLEEYIWRRAHSKGNPFGAIIATIGDQYQFPLHLHPVNPPIQPPPSLLPPPTCPLQPAPPAGPLQLAPPVGPLQPPPPTSPLLPPPPDSLLQPPPLDVPFQLLPRAGPLKPPQLVCPLQPPPYAGPSPLQLPSMIVQNLPSSFLQVIQSPSDSPGLQVTNKGLKK
eukprot:TCALIF_13696-PA protein Name:"Protein of unknown function" AED:0.70 eAED:0.70 QI:0/-1/0/1/-1/1/1/0/183